VEEEMQEEVWEAEEVLQAREQTREVE